MTLEKIEEILRKEIYFYDSHSFKTMYRKDVILAIIACIEARDQELVAKLEARIAGLNWHGTEPDRRHTGLCLAVNIIKQGT